MLGDFGLIKTLGDAEIDRRLLTESGETPMPYHYRTPDLISYAKGESSISPKSDVFQLGLVAAELFTGFNPQVAAENILDDLQMRPVPRIPGKYGRHLRELINRMLVEDPEQREGAAELITSWQGVFENVAKDVSTLEGKVFKK